jgi:hypothetical protein
MLLPSAASGSAGGLGGVVNLAGKSLLRSRATHNGSITITELASQWSNPSDVSTLLMIIGGDVVQSALAQSTGKWYTPVCFSFGWVSYAFIALLHVIGDGRLLPPPDYPVTVINLKSGYARDNKNWVIGRLLRDGQAFIERRAPMDDYGIRISVFEAQKRRTATNPTRFNFDRSHIFGLGVMLVQLAIASIPVILNREWGVLFITAGGTALAQIAGSLPQWRAEKLPNRQHSNEIWALTTGNGSKDIMVIFGRGECLDLEEFCVSDTPRNGKPWEKFKEFSKPRKDNSRKPKIHRTGTELRKSRAALGLPYGFIVTRVASVLLSILWLLLLINVAAIKDSTWYVLLVGAIGMFQNGILAAMERPPETRNIPLRHADTIRTNKVMDGLMDFEFTYKCGRPLLAAFFPGDLRPDEKLWWDGKQTRYDKAREAEQMVRGVPRQFLPPIRTASDLDRFKAELHLDRGSNIDSMSEKRAGNPFSDPDTANKSDTSRTTSLKPLAVSFLSSHKIFPPDLERNVSGSGHRRPASAPRSALRSGSILPMETTAEESEQARPSLTFPGVNESRISSLSTEEVRESARPPDWAF